MARGYSVNGPSASGTANKTAAAIIASTSVRPRLFEFAVGLTTPPNSTDQQLEYAVTRFTANGTAGSTPTPLAVDPGDVAAVATTGITYSGEPTYLTTQFLYDNAENQRALFRWVAVPGFEFLAPATASNGIGLYNKAITAASVITGTLMWTE